MSIWGDHALHAVAWLALRSLPPEDAKRVVDQAARLVRPYSIVHARRTSRRLARWGTCLSRSLTVAARLPDAEVVIGVHLRSHGRFRAHAWVEVEETPLHDVDVAGTVIVRLRRYV
jgi:hypothetical protein